MQSRGDRSGEVNVLALYGAGTRPTWNGSAVTPDNVRQYLGVTKQMNPQPVFMLVVTPRADCREVDAYRQMATEILKCGPGQCVELSP